MSNPHIQIEQDRAPPPSEAELPSYDDLVAQNGPNSRFGRWRGWIEKRAAERYLGVTPEERQRRKERGWDLEEGPRRPPPLQEDVNIPIIARQPPTPGPPELRIQINNFDSLETQRQSSPDSTAPIPFVSQRILPSHLKLNHFGSRFLPHATSQIRCILPLTTERLLLIGHDEGLSVLDMFPRVETEYGSIDVKTPNEAQVRPIWEGEGVLQMTIIEQEEAADGLLQGVVLALVGPEPGSPSPKDCESSRSIRMYSLSSLASLAKWAVVNKGTRPLDLRRPSNWQVQTTPTKRHRHQGSLARGLRSLIDNPSGTHSQIDRLPIPYHQLTPTASDVHPDNRSSSSLTSSSTLVPSRRSTHEWDMVDDVPLRWATDFVPLATPHSRLLGLSVTSYTLWTDENRTGRGGQILAVATKSSILLYQTPKGERAFRFVKEFYTPLQPRSIAFFQQVVQEVTRSVSDITGSRFNHKRSDSTNTLRQVGGNDPRNTPTPAVNYGVQLCLFVIFDKKASWIRIADSAVGEMDLPDDSYISPLNRNSFIHDSSLNVNVAAGTHRVRSRLSFENASPPRWIPPFRCELPVPNGPPDITRKVIFLTRGRKTHILPSPLPTSYAAYPSLAIVTWKSPPRHVVARVCEADNDETQDLSPFLQLVAFGEDGMEIQEMSLNFISRNSKGKNKAVYEEVVCAEDDVVGDCGFLAVGGHWDQVSKYLKPEGLSRSASTKSDASSASIDSVATSAVLSRLKREAGAYAWWRKGANDYRVFWVGGSSGNQIIDG